MRGRNALMVSSQFLEFRWEQPRSSMSLKFFASGAHERARNADHMPRSCLISVDIVKRITPAKSARSPNMVMANASIP